MQPPTEPTVEGLERELAGLTTQLRDEVPRLEHLRTEVNAWDVGARRAGPLIDPACLVGMVLSPVLIYAWVMLVYGGWL